MRLSTILLIFLWVGPVCAQTTNPQAEIRNELVRARIYLPDTLSGYYRGTRFDWSGVMPELEFQGHQYFGQWFETYDPVLHDAIVGPVEEFTPMGYIEADQGSCFVKIGVGTLSKPEEPRYDRTKYYVITNHGRWKVNIRSDRIRFKQVLIHERHGYKYVKIIRLAKGKPVMQIDHSLRNRGKYPIETSVYNHNFFVIDSTIIGPEHIITLPFEIGVDETKVSDLADIKTNQITLKRRLIDGETVRFGTIQGFSDSTEDYDIRIENRLTKAGVRITSDRPLSRIVFWAMHKTFTPEPFIDISIQPRKEFKWRTNYEFYTLEGEQ